MVRRLGPGAALIVVASTTLLLAACGSSAKKSGGGGGTPAASAPAGAHGVGGSPAAPIDDTPSSAGAGASSARPADAATTAAVTKAYVTFFADASTTPQSEAVLQHGASFHAALVAEGKESYATKSSASVSSVSLVSPTVAAVKYTINSNGASVLVGVQGMAVLEDGTWKVAAATFCSLLTLEGHPAPACNDPSITALTG